MSDRIIKLFALLIALLAAPTSNLFGDDMPKTYCVSVSSRVESIRTYDLSPLNQNEQSNVRYYLENLTRSNLEIPPRLNVLKGQFFRNQPLDDANIRLTLIFANGDCENRCIGTAVLPGPAGTKLREFSYRKNLVIRPGSYPFASDGHETAIGSLILLDKNERSLIAFHDVFNKTAANRELKYVRSEYLRFTPENVGIDLRKNYLACLQNVFPVDAAMPGSGAN